MEPKRQGPACHAGATMVATAILVWGLALAAIGAELPVPGLAGPASSSSPATPAPAPPPAKACNCTAPPAAAPAAPMAADAGTLAPLPGYSYQSAPAVSSGCYSGSPAGVVYSAPAAPYAVPGTASGCYGGSSAAFSYAAPAAPYAAPAWSYGSAWSSPPVVAYGAPAAPYGYAGGTTLLDVDQYAGIGPARLAALRTRGALRYYFTGRIATSSYAAPAPRFYSTAPAGGYYTRAVCGPAGCYVLP